MQQPTRMPVSCHMTFDQVTYSNPKTYFQGLKTAVYIHFVLLMGSLIVVFFFLHVKLSWHWQINDPLINYKKTNNDSPFVKD